MSSPPDPLPSDQAIQAAHWAMPGAICEYDEDKHCNVPLSADDEEAAIAGLLTAAYLIDMSRREAEVRAATLRQVEAWLKAEAEHRGHGHQHDSLNFAAVCFAAHFNQEAE